jgi:hypothetical protein
LAGHYDADITTNQYGTGEIPITILDEAIQKLPPHSDDIFSSYWVVSPILSIMLISGQLG